MRAHAVCFIAVLALLLAGSSTIQAQSSGYRGQSLDLLRLLAAKPWIGQGAYNRWDRAPSIDVELGPDDLNSIEYHDADGNDGNIMNNEIRVGSSKRSAVATALNSGRRRRQPAPALGKAVTPYVGVGVLNDMGSFFDSLRGNLETLASLSPEERSSFYQEPPTVVHSTTTNSGGGGSGHRRIYALRPLKPTNYIRSYNRRSFEETDGGYPGANHHDPALLWTGLGR